MRRLPIAGSLLALFLTAPLAAQSQSGSSRDLFGQVLGLVAQTAVDSLPLDSLYERAARGLIAELKDPYAALLSPAEQAAFQRNSLGNRYAGIGATVRSQGDHVTLYRVNGDSPAMRAGLRAGDRILKVGAVTVSGLAVDSVTKFLLGTPGSQVQVTYERVGSGSSTVTITRGEIRPPAVPYAMLMGDRIGYVSIQRFNQTAALDVATAVRDLAAQGARGYILDLRGNPGGDLDAATTMAGLFLREGQEVARVKHRSQDPLLYHSEVTVPIGDAPIAVLVDGGSASASEIVAGSLQDHDRAIVVGTRTFGKGLVQTQRVLPNGWALRLTTGKWYTPSGRSIQADHGGLGDERFVEADTNGARPTFRSDAGRVVLGGGGVTPEVLITADTASTAERTLARALTNRMADFQNAAYEVARAVQPTVKQGFAMQPAWRDSLFARMGSDHMGITREQFDAASEAIDRLLERQIAGLAIGDGDAFRRQAPEDRQFMKALELVQRAAHQRDLFTLASRG